MPESGVIYKPAEAAANMANVLKAAGEKGKAKQLYAVALKVLKDEPDRRYEAQAITSLARLGIKDDAFAIVDRSAVLFREASDRYGDAVAIFDDDVYRIGSDTLEVRSRGRVDIERTLAFYVALQIPEEATARAVPADLGS